MTNTTTTTTRVPLDAAAEVDVPAATQVVWLFGIERRVRCFPLRFRSTTSGSSQIASGVVGPDVVRTGSVYVEETPVVLGRRSTPDAASSDYLDVEVGPT